MPAVFPTLGSLGYSAKRGCREILRVYDDGTYRRYLKSSFNHREVNLVLKDVKAATKDAVNAFFDARKLSGSDSEFYLYNPDETTTLDFTGSATTGRHLAIFLEPEFEITRSGRCRWSGSVRIKLLN